MTPEPIDYPAKVIELPPEIWLRVFEYAHGNSVRPSYYRGEHDPTSVLSISLVCSAWNTLAEPLLYRNIALIYEPFFDRPDLLESIRNSLRNQPHRYQFVQSLDLRYSYRNKAARVINHDILENLRQMTGLRSLRVDSDEEGQLDHTIMDYVCTMAVETLTLHRMWVNLMLSQYLATGFVDGFRSLKTLVLADGISSTTEDSFPAMMPRTSKLEDITVDSDCHPQILYEVLRWPKALEKVDIGTLYNEYACAGLYNTATVQKILDCQSTSLKQIRLPAYDCRDDPFPDFSRYTSLTRLRLSKHNVFTCQPQVAAKKLSCPHLEVLDINMNDEGEWGGTIRSQEFQKNHADWVLDFTTHYRTLYPRGSLRTVHIGFHWYGNYAFVRPDLEKIWPNAYLKMMRSAVKVLGFDLTWPEPAMTEEEWADQYRKTNMV